jgi:sugar lactone lactonase YvrE
MRMTNSLLCAALLAFTGCGSSSSSLTHTTGSTYETSAPITVSTIAGTAGTSGTTDANGISALFGQPNGIIASPDGKTLYVADYGNNTIRQMVLATGAVTTIAGSAGASGTTDATGSAARFNGPHLLTTDGTNLFVPDFNNNSIRKVVIATGVVTTLAGSTSGAAGLVDATGSAARFNGPGGVTITPDGATLYVTDYNNSVVRKVVVATGAVTTVTTTAPLGNPAGIICDATGTNLYLTDFTANTIDKLVISSGALTILAGSTANYGSADGVGSLASFYTPNGITLVGNSLYVTDTGDDLVRKVSISTGAVTTVAGSAAVAGVANGAGGAAGFSGPLGITTDGTNLFVADAGNKTIREIQ